MLFSYIRPRCTEGIHQGKKWFLKMFPKISFVFNYVSNHNYHVTNALQTLIWLIVILVYCLSFQLFDTTFWTICLSFGTESAPINWFPLWQKEGNNDQTYQQYESLSNFMMINRKNVTMYSTPVREPWKARIVLRLAK